MLWLSISRRTAIRSAMRAQGTRMQVPLRVISSPVTDPVTFAPPSGRTVIGPSGISWPELAKSQPPKDKPWYHLLVDGVSRTTYVAERHLETDPNSGPVNHALIGAIFERFENGIYVPKIVAN